MYSFPSKSGYESHDALLALQDLEHTLRGRRVGSSGCDATDMPSAEGTPCDARDLTPLAIWRVSSAKPGNGVEQLLDNNSETYWQSDGPQPHTISAQFIFKASISEVQIYLNYEKDESYTPAMVSVHAGNNTHDLHLVRRLRRLRNPAGWVRIPLGESAEIIDDDSDDDSDSDYSTPSHELSAEEMAERNVRRQKRARRRERRKAERQAVLDSMQTRAEQGANGPLEALKDRSITKAHMIQISIHNNHQNGRDSHVRMVRILGPSRQIASYTTPFTSQEFQVFQELR